MIDPSKPDLEESVNVTEAHERVIRGAAAASRESKLKENGAEPISLWVLIMCAVPLLAAGWTLGKAGKLFSYKDITREGYVRLIPDDGEGVKLPPVPWLEASIKKGHKEYSKCTGCHGADGKGDGASYPSLAGSKWVNGETEVFAMVILNGLTGPTSSGKTYGVMPAQSAGLSGESLAHLMNYIRHSFGNDASGGGSKPEAVVTKEMGATALEISGKRAKAGAAVTGDELTADHHKNLPGTPIDPKMMVDPITLEPAEAK
ncbi:c-type cytochrome [Luteolibacter flavescens]|uniref:C-type cytochrome n=1 Tax=Luteolibacter flavescens TaxID=1859460 RepID=A0ABT3FPC3_9BACT|nr:c-type cytochrome [Luteolibacter flavescens]MCW1885414.1 c-type cytochrome [Luteolibacter flavescens]